jgi:hypothetical protein
MITAADLVRLLQDKDQNEKVEALIATSDGRIIVAYIGDQAKSMAKAIKLFVK